MSDTPLLDDDPDADMPPYVTVAQVGDIPEGQGRAFPVGKQMVAVFFAEGNYFAIDDFCPHQGASLAEGFVEDCAVACPWHYWRFSIKDGSWLDNPKIAVAKYNVRVQGTNIQVQEPPQETSAKEPGEDS